MLTSPGAVRGRSSPWMLLLGFSLGGFFDGILLHQILQWHHLLSLAPGKLSLRTQLLWDGYFHALMYVLTLIALWRIWRSRSDYDWSGSVAVPPLLIGFGVWHVVDALLSHWLLGIHRVRVAAPNPLFWDVLWLGIFGIGPVVIGWLWKRRAGHRHSRRRKPGGIAPLMALTGITAAAGLMAGTSPASDQELTTVVFAPGIRPADAFNAIKSAGGRVAWAAPDLSVASIAVSPDRRAELYLRGALLVAGTGIPGGCASWSQPV